MPSTTSSYFVAFVDLLGQAKAAAKMDAPPQSDSERAAWQQTEEMGLIVRGASPYCTHIRWMAEELDEGRFTGSTLSVRYT
jgi:hypothetical protein